MPAVINVGGPVTWGIVVLVSAWAIRVGRALAGRRRVRHKDLEYDALVHDPNANQPRYLQRLSATAIRMLIETGALPCAVLELADGAAAGSQPMGGGSRGRAAAASSSAAKGPAAANSQQRGSAGVSGTALDVSAPPRIVPPELAAAVPCMSVAAWVRALANPEAWHAELTREAAVAGGGVALPTAGSSSLRSPYASSYSSSVGWDGCRGGGLASGGLCGGARRGGPALVPGQLCGVRPPSVQPGPNVPRQQEQQEQQEQEQHHSLGGPSASGSAARGGEWEVKGPPPEALRGPSGGSAATSLSAAAAANLTLLSYPPRTALLVVLGRSERSVSAVTAAAAAAGYSRVAAWVGPSESFAAASLRGPRLPSLGRHALWLMLGLGPEPLFHVPSLVLDVRRPDERLLFGSIRGTVNIPADELAASLALPAAEFRRRHGVARPGPGPGGDGVVVLHSRSGRRAAWAAQVCWDAGLTRVFVYGEGVCGWRLEDRVKPYRAYDLGALPPDPEPFSPEEPDEATGFEELHALGLPLRPGPPPSRFAAAHPLTTGAGAGPGPSLAPAANPAAGAVGNGSGACLRLRPGPVPVPACGPVRESLEAAELHVAAGAGGPGQGHGTARV